jgi:hypothetical protein
MQTIFVIIQQMSRQKYRVLAEQVRIFNIKGGFEVYEFRF